MRGLLFAGIMALSCATRLLGLPYYEVTDLGANVVARAINSHGQMTGDLTTAGGQNHAFLYDGTIHDLGTLGGTHSSGGGISDSGMVTGSSDTMFNASVHAFTYDGSMHDIGVLAESLSYGRGINSSGKVAVDAFLNGRPRGFLYDGTMHDLGTLGGEASHVHAINDANQIVGDAYLPGNIQRAALWDGTWHELGTLGGRFSVAS